MDTLKFKTTIKCSGCIAKATPFLNETVGENKWEVDVTNPMKILTVTAGKDARQIVEAVEKAGFKAEPLS